MPNDSIYNILADEDSFAALLDFAKFGLAAAAFIIEIEQDDLITGFREVDYQRICEKLPPIFHLATEIWPSPRAVSDDATLLSAVFFADEEEPS